MYILSDFKEDACHSCILADRYVFVIGNFKILNNIIKYTFGNLSVFTCTTGFNRAFYIFRKMLVGFDTELFNDICKSAYFYLTHMYELLSDMVSLFQQIPGNFPGTYV